MFNIKYNFLVITQITLGIINYVLLLRIFGVSIQSDSYLLATSALTVFFIFVTLPFSQIIPYYNNLKIISQKKSQDFYNSGIIFAVILGLIIYIILNMFLPNIIKLFVFNIDMERFDLFKSLIKILSTCLIFYPLNQINEQLFNAEMKFSLPYILSCIPLGIITLTQVGMIYFNNKNVLHLATAQGIGVMLIAIIGTVYIHKTLIRFRMVGLQKDLIKQIKNSCILKFGDFGWGIAIPILFNNFLVMFPNGYVSYFYYARRILDITNKFSIGPSARILRSKISKYLAQKDILPIKEISKNFLLYGGAIFLIVLVGAYFLQAPILKLVTINKLTYEDLNLIMLIFLTLIPWYIIIFFETPFVAITYMGKKAKETLAINMLFLIIFAPLLFILKPICGIYALGFSTTIAQIFNLICYIKVSKKVLNINREETV